MRALEIGSAGGDLAGAFSVPDVRITELFGPALSRVQQKVNMNFSSPPLPPSSGSGAAKPGVPLFNLGRIVTTKGAMILLLEAGSSPLHFLLRHARGDWGKVHSDDLQLNEEALRRGSRLMSVYDVEVPFPDSDRKLVETLWIITDSDRSVTTVLLPEEY